MGIIKDKVYLSSNYTPKNLPAREDLVDEIYQTLKLTRCRMLLAGLTGTGKTISVKKAMEKLGKDYLLVYINCSESSNYSSITQKIVREVRNKNYRVAGKTRAELAEYLEKMLKTNRRKHIVFIFDEVDKILKKQDNHQEIFFPLTNHGDSSFILISNDTGILDKFDPRIYSRLGVEPKNIKTYSIDETYQILKQRAELALKKNAFDSDVLLDIAQHGANMGDIRFALRCLEQTAIFSEKFNKSKIDKEAVEFVIESLEVIEFNSRYASLSRQLRTALAGVCLNAIENNGYAITYPDSFNNYVFTCKQNKLFPVGERRFRYFLSQLEMMDFITLQNKSTNKQGGRLRIAVPNFDFRKFVSDSYR